MSERNTSKRFSVPSLILSICFLGFIAFILVATICTSGRSLARSLGRTAASEHMKTDDPGIVDEITARIDSLDSTMQSKLYLSDEMGYFASSFQYALGKDIVNIGNAAMYQTPDGYLYDMTDERDFTPEIEEIAAFRNALGNIPFLYIHEQALLTGDSDAENLPAGYADLDFSNENSDAIIASLQAAGIDVLDSRQILGDTGLARYDLMLRTDHHWTPLGNLIMAKSVAEALRDLCGAEVDPSLLDLSLFDTELYPSILLGERGQRIGIRNIAADDITLYYPVYDTSIARVTRQKPDEEAETFTGSFYESMIRWDAMERGDSGFNTTSNGAYGFTEEFDHYHNDAGAPCTLLVLKDSYSGQVSSFLSLLFRDIYVVDLRKTSEDGMYYFDEIQPDIVVTGFCQQMLIDHKYTLFKGASVVQN